MAQRTMARSRHVQQRSASCGTKGQCKIVGPSRLNGAVNTGEVAHRLKCFREELADFSQHILHDDGEKQIGKAWRGAEAGAPPRSPTPLWFQQDWKKRSWDLAHCTSGPDLLAGRFGESRHGVRGCPAENPCKGRLTPHGHRCSEGVEGISLIVCVILNPPHAHRGQGVGYLRSHVECRGMLVVPVTIPELRGHVPDALHEWVPLCVLWRHADCPV